MSQKPELLVKAAASRVSTGPEHILMGNGIWPRMLVAPVLACARETSSPSGGRCPWAETRSTKLNRSEKEVKG